MNPAAHLTQKAEPVVSLRFGAVSPKLARQLAAHHLDRESIRHWQMDADAITRLVIRRLLTDAQAKQARQKLIDAIARAIAGGAS